MQLPRVPSLVLAGAVAGHLALAGCFGGGTAAAPGAASPGAKASYAGLAADSLAFPPADSEIVLGLDIQQFLSSPLWKQFEPRLRSMLGNKLSEFKSKCGYDPFDTLRDLTVGFKLRDNDKPTGVVVVRGVDRDKTLACLPQAFPGREATLADGFVTFPATEGEDPSVMTFVDASTSVVYTGPQATRAALEAALAAGVPLRKSRAFSELWAQLDPEQTMWLVLNGNAKMFDALAQLGSRPRSIVGSVGLANGLAASARVRFESADQATQLAALLQGQLGTFKSAFDVLDIAAEAEDLTVKASMSPQQLEALIGLLGGLIPGASSSGAAPAPPTP